MMPSNPFREGMPAERIAEPCTMVIFGASGDLTKRKLVPALYNIARDRLLPAGFSVVGFARRPWSDDQFRQEMLDGVNEHSRSRPADPGLWSDFASGLYFHQGDFGDADAYRRLAMRLTRIETERATYGNHIFYLATPPDHYAEIIRGLGLAGLAGSTRAPWARIIVEKPFGVDLESATALNTMAHEVFSEEQIYRIDHYLGKETVQNILVMRFANGIFEPLWNQKYIDHVQITVAEDSGVGSRAGYYDSAGALRDMVQNHMMQLLCLTAMEAPVAFSADAVRNEKVKVLQAIRPMDPAAVSEHVVRARYARGFVGGRDVPGFLEEKGVAAGSSTETYVAIRMYIDNWRWAGVPFYLRTGKRLPKRATEIAIQFKQVPHLLFSKQQPGAIQPNVLALGIQPDERIALKMASKVPGTARAIQPVLMEFRYGDTLGEGHPEAYERLLLDSMLGDSTLFTRRDEVEAAWEFCTAILNAWGTPGVSPPQEYEAGSWGPQAADRLVDHWRRV